jgi:IS605 OrfB family transposase
MSKRTIRCKMQPTSTMAARLTATMKVFSEAATQAATHGIGNNIALHKACYADLRERFGLPANLTIRALRRAAASVVRAKRHGGNYKPSFKPTSIDYDARVFQFRERDETVSLSTLEGRIHIPLVLGGYQRKALTCKTPTAATVTRRDRNWYIHIVVEDTDAAPVTGGGVMGIDLGIRNIVTASTGMQESGANRQSFKAERARIRASLQSKGTRGAKRVLKRLSGYETRRIRHENHVLAKAIITEAQNAHCGVIRMEELKGIRARTKIRSKHLNRMVSGWSFGQLQEFVAYKSRRAGITFEKVPAAYTSQTCHRCGERGERDGDVFRCTTCGVIHADVNASFVIAAGGATVTRPESTHCANFLA